MESMLGKFSLANRPRMTRRKRKNLHLTPGASCTTSTSRTCKGGNSPTTEPTNADVPPSGSSYAGRSPTEPDSGSGPHRRVKGTQQSRRLKRGGNPYSWMPSNDNPSSPTTEETLPITPRSDMSSTFSVSPSPGPSYQQPQSPVHRRRNAVSAGPQRTGFEFLHSTGFTPASAPLIPTQTWPMSSAEGARQFPEHLPSGLVQTQFDGSFEPRRQTLPTVLNAEYCQFATGASGITVSFNPDQQSSLTNSAMSNFQPSHSFDQPSNSRIDSSLSEQAFHWGDSSQPYSLDTTAEHGLLTFNNDFSLGPPSSVTGHLNMAYVDYTNPYLSANQTDQAHFYGLPNSYIPSPMADLGIGSHLQGISPTPQRISDQLPQEANSLASRIFNNANSTQ